MTPSGPAWRIARDVASVHALLCDSDAYQAERSGTAAPARRMATTRRLVESGAVRVFAGDAAPTAMFTLTDDPPFALAEAGYGPSARPMYLQRLAVGAVEAAGGSLLGAQAVRRAIEEARELGATVLRCEASPDIAGTWQLLTTLGFRQQGPVHADGAGRRWAYLERPVRDDG